MTDRPSEAKQLGADRQHRLSTFVRLLATGAVRRKPVIAVPDGKQNLAITPDPQEQSEE